MRRTLLLLLLATALALGGCSALTPPKRTLTVTGSGSARMTPDVVSVTLGIQTRNDDVAQAVSENNVVAARIMEAARGIGISDADMRTVYFSVYAQPTYDEFGSPTSRLTYTVDNNLEVRLRDVTKLSDLLQTAVNAGANSIYGVNFTAGDTGAAEDEARTEALGDAEERAAELATAAGLTLGGIQSVSTSQFGVPQPYYPGFGLGGGGDGAAGVPTAPGTLEVTAQVTVIYEFR